MPREGKEKSTLNIASRLIWAMRERGLWNKRGIEEMREKKATKEYMAKICIIWNEKLVEEKPIK